jgi:hypothetical protein
MTLSTKTKAGTALAMQAEQGGQHERHFWGNEPKQAQEPIIDALEYSRHGMDKASLRTAHSATWQDETGQDRTG